MHRSHPALIGPPMPELAANIWRWFVEISNRRGAVLTGAGPITWAEIDAWRRLTGNRPQPWEVKVLLVLDDLYLKVRAEGMGKK